MTLPSSGALSFSNIQTEFGGANPISMTEYYGRSGLPASGQISLSNFYGKSAIVVALNDVFIGGSGNQHCGFRLDATGLARQYSNSTGIYSNSYTWLLSGNPQDYEIEAFRNDFGGINGNIATVGGPQGFDVWASLLTDKIWTFNNSGGAGQNATMAVNIRRVGTSRAEILDGCTVNISF